MQSNTDTMFTGLNISLLFALYRQKMQVKT